jgi:hypothetical protein
MTSTGNISDVIFKKLFCAETLSKGSPSCEEDIFTVSASSANLSILFSFLHSKLLD